MEVIIIGTNALIKFNKTQTIYSLEEKVENVNAILVHSCTGRSRAVRCVHEAFPKVVPIRQL